MAVSCKNGGLCPGGIDLDNPKDWIRIVKNDGQSGAVQGIDINFATPLDVIEFDGLYKPQGKQKENWVIVNNSCRIIQRCNTDVVAEAYKKYGYHGFWNNYKPYLTEDEFTRIAQPSESIMKVTDIEIYKTQFGKAKIDFNWFGARYRIKDISMTDREFYGPIKNGNVKIDAAYIVISIPKDIDEWTNPQTGQKQMRAYKFVSKIFKV